MKKLLPTTVILYFVFSLNAQTAKITVDINKSLAPISKDFWGSNFLYWKEDDASLANDKLAKLLKDMPCNVLRYPGGTIADNFHWKTAKLDNSYIYPYESSEAESNFDEFMTFCKKVGAEPMLVVNTQSWFMKGKVEEGAQYAADWVEYSKDRGYKVRYWEIGNETYWHPVMTAREYGALVVKYSEAMKKVDPDIIISANGHWDKDMVGTKERTDPQFIAKFARLAKAADDIELAKLMKEGKEMLVENNITNGSEKWWDNVLDVCGNHIDMLSIHWYFHKNNLVNIEPKLNELKALVTNKMHGKQYKWAITEFNCNTDNDSERVVGFVEGLGKFLSFGFDVATFWPMRISGMEHRSMFSLKSINPQYPYEVFQLFSKELRGNIVNCSFTKKIYAFASVSKEQVTIVLTGNPEDKVTDTSVELPGLNLKNKIIEAKSYTAKTTGKRRVNLQCEPLVVSSMNQALQLTVGRNAFVVVTIKTYCPNK